VRVQVSPSAGTAGGSPGSAAAAQTPLNGPHRTPHGAGSLTLHYKEHCSNIGRSAVSHITEKAIPVHLQKVNRIATAALIAVALVALLDVLLLGYMRPPLRDEGAGAHIFQLSAAALMLAGLVFLATADWTQPTRVVRRLALPAVLMVLALAALFYLEHYFYPAHYPALYQ
jgi:hypothetical protein